MTYMEQALTVNRKAISASKTKRRASKAERGTGVDHEDWAEEGLRHKESF